MENTAIQFYHLRTTHMGIAVAKLLEKALSAGMNSVLLVGESDIDMFDKLLWEYSQDSFLPHGARGCSFPDLQPVYITHQVDDNPNGARLLIIANGEEYDGETMRGYERIFDIFDGNDEGALRLARDRWKKYKDAGYRLTYVQQNSRGGWEVKLTVE